MGAFHFLLIQLLAVLPEPNNDRMCLKYLRDSTTLPPY